MAEEILLTQQEFDKLSEEHEYLVTVRRKEVSEHLKEAKSYGDLSENSEYDAAKNEQAKLYGRIAEIEDILAHAVIIVDENEANNLVGLGCTVTVKDLETGKKIVYKITGSQEANPMQFLVSSDSPFGRGLLGHAVGETVKVEAPAGDFLYEILEIEN